MGACSVIERAARALVGDHPDRPWESLSPESQARWTEAARAVLTAIREPSEGMINRAYNHMEANGNDPRFAWEAMIDAMLEEG